MKKIRPARTWRQYQNTLKRAGGRYGLGRFAPGWFVVLAVAVIFGLVVAAIEFVPFLKNSEPRPDNLWWSKQQIRKFLGGQRLWDVAEEPPDLIKMGMKYSVSTTLDLEFQDHILKTFDTTHARAIALVAMEPDSGRVLVMAGHNKDPDLENPCTEVLFPAASVFKIVTAAAAMESSGFAPGTPVMYNGKKHTLYKSQLSKKDNRWTRHLTLKEAFAQSVNPVFGKLGVNSLGKDALLSHALDFGFNQELGFEFYLAPSMVKVPKNSFGIAEVASGFNRETLITPMHGAMMASAVVHNGILPEPTVVDTVEDWESDIVYKSRFTPVGRAAKEQTCAYLRELMVSAALSGTGRATFGGRKRDKVLKNLVIGGKTGSINNDTEYGIRYDWFVGFAYDADKKKKLAVSALAAHDKFIGPKAADYARAAIKYYFK